MTIAELIAELAKMEADKDAWIVVNGKFVPVAGVTGNIPNGSYVLVRGQGKIQQSNRFTIDEEGIVGQLVRFGLTDAEIGEVLGSPGDQIQKKRKGLGLTST